MHIIKKPRWNIKEQHVTCEKIALSRRNFLRKSSAFSIVSTASGNLLGQAALANEKNPKLNEVIKSNMLNMKINVTPENLTSRYNNFF